MDEKRINPETGRLEKNEGRIFPQWEPEKNADGHQQRIDPRTG